MSPQLKPLLLPQLVEERRRFEVHQHAPDTGNSFVYYTTNSSASDLTTPLTPTFSARGQFRFSSSTSSLELPTQLQESPSSPAQSQTAKHSLPDVQEVQEEHLDRAGYDTLPANQLGLYSCLCDGPCPHRSIHDDVLPGDAIGDCDYDLDFDCGFLSDGDTPADMANARGKRFAESSFVSMTSRFGSRFPTLSRWASHRRTKLMSSPTTEVRFDHAMAYRAPSSRSSSMSASTRHFPDGSIEHTLDPTPEISYRGSTESFHSLPGIDIPRDNREILERDRALATTPLLPPLLTDSLKTPPVESPLQSPNVQAPNIASSSVMTEIHSPLPWSTGLPSRPPLSTKPSTSSLRHGSSIDLPLSLSGNMPERDEWSDRLGHANFTIQPAPYEPETCCLEALQKLREDHHAARVNYTRHLVRTGENYGQTSKIYALTEAKWAETEKKWGAALARLEVQNGGVASRPAGAAAATPTGRIRSRANTRSRSGSVGASIAGRSAHDTHFAAIQWGHVKESFPSAVPQMLEALDAEGKFPSRGDEDIVGPMHRDVAMARTHSEEGRGTKFWKNLAGKVGIRK